MSVQGKSYEMNIWTHVFLHTIQVVMSHHCTHLLKLTYLDSGSQLLSNYTKSSESFVPINIDDVYFLCKTIFCIHFGICDHNPSLID